MTGLHVGHARIRLNRSVRGQDHLLDADVTVAEILKRADYATRFFGKWGIGTLRRASSRSRFSTVRATKPNACRLWHRWSALIPNISLISLSPAAHHCFDGQVRPRFSVSEATIAGCLKELAVGSMF